MICSYIKNNNYGFVKLHAEQVYTYISEAALNSCKLRGANDPNNDIQLVSHTYLSPVVYANRLTVTTLIELIEYLEELVNYPKFFFLDFEHIISIQKNLKKHFNKLEELIKNNDSKLHFINFNIDIETSSVENNLEYLKNFSHLNKANSKKILNGIEFETLIETSRSIFQSENHKRLIDSFVPQTPPYLHESSSVYLTTYFDFTRFISKDFFIYYCLYNLALKMISKNEYHDWEITPSKNIVLFCTTLNGSYIGSILGDLLGADLFLIDHLGPINKIYSNSQFCKIDKSASYIVVSDVLCLGTEVKNSKSIIDFSGAKYIGNVSFLRIESRKEEDIDFNDIEFYYRITNEYNPVNYKILTALDKSNE